VRVWDVSPGYLDRPRLLGEHRELHGVHVILTEGKRGYASHPETCRWDGCLVALSRRHGELAAEMRLRGYTDRTTLPVPRGSCRWPRTFVTEPAGQFALLRRKYGGASEGRIPLPRNVQQLWAHHKYSVMARSVSDYQAIGRLVARKGTAASIADLSRILVRILREPPRRARLVNALEHMWGHVRPDASTEEIAGFRNGPAAAALAIVQAVAMRCGEPYLVRSTALSELAVYC
jgi:uncharacterized protein YbgA (DUF1722 family)